MAKPKPTVAIRRPPSDAEAFVAGQTKAPKRSDVQTSKRSDAPAATTRPGIVQRKDGRERRRLTVYLSPKLATQLAVHCAGQGLEMSDVIEQALAAHLA
jgi:hypothetical protein